MYSYCLCHISIYKPSRWGSGQGSYINYLVLPGLPGYTAGSAKLHVSFLTLSEVTPSPVFDTIPPQWQSENQVRKLKIVETRGFFSNSLDFKILKKEIKNKPIKYDNN